MKSITRDVRLDIIVFGTLIALANVPLLYGSVFRSLVFFPGDVLAGQWWRVATFPFVHLSWYHLLLDAGAFLALYGGLYEPGRLRRLALVAASCAGSLLLPLAAAPALLGQGLCGLSGTAHGLMAVSGLEMMALPGADRSIRYAGLAYFAIVVIKCMAETFTGSVVFGFLYFGMMGIPVAMCHAGGVLGGILAYAALSGNAAGAPAVSRLAPVRT